MITGLVEIAEDGRYLSVKRGFLAVSQDGVEIGRVPLDDIAVLILTARHLSLSRSVIDELMQRKAVIVTCGPAFVPSGVTWPVAAHHAAAGILHTQIHASKPLKKRLWQQLVTAKIAAQRSILLWHGGDQTVVRDLAILGRQVKSGDPDNREAQAARLYWPALMGGTFRRSRGGGGANSALNYGYTVLRSAVIRALCGAGLNPTLGLHHGTAVNSFALADDVMEPFRPAVDHIARDLGSAVDDGLDPDSKRRLAGVLDMHMTTNKGASPLHQALAETSQSLAQCLAGDRKRLDIATFAETPLRL